MTEGTPERASGHDGPVRLPVPLSIGPLDHVDQDAVRALADAAREADGVAPLSEQPLLRLGADEPWLTHVAVRTKSGVVVGYAQVDRGGHDASAELVVHPEHRRGGIGRLLLRTCERDARLPQFSGTPGQRGKDLRVWAHGDTEAARAFAAASGYAVVRELLLLSVILRERSESQDPDQPSGLGPATEPVLRREAIAVRRMTGAVALGPLPEGYRLRPFVPGADDDAWVALNARAFADHPEQGRLTLDDLHARMAEPWFDAAGFLLAEAPDGSLAGFHWTKVHPADPETAAHGEVYALGVDPAHQGAGLGRALLDAGLAHLATRVRDVVLYVDGDNAAALRVYERSGFVRRAIDVQYGRAASATISA